MHLRVAAPPMEVGSSASTATFTFPFFVKFFFLQLGLTFVWGFQNKQVYSIKHFLKCGPHQKIILRKYFELLCHIRTFFQKNKTKHINKHANAFLKSAYTCFLSKLHTQCTSKNMHKFGGNQQKERKKTKNKKKLVFL